MTRAVALAVVFLVLTVGGRSVPVHATTLDTHTTLLDSNNKLLSWVQPQDQAYGRVSFLSWKLLQTQIPNDPTNGLPVTFTHSEYRPTDLSGTGWPNNPAGKNAMLADAAVMYYAYSADTGVVDLVRDLLDHQLVLGTTSPSYNWPRVPWSTAAAGSTTYGNDSSVEGVGVLEPDKVGELGYHGYLRFYELTGDTRYRDAAIDCANALASHVRTGNATQSPWPFRVDADDGTIREQYCADVIAPIRLFDELIRLGLGNVAAYQSARQTAWNWLMTYPMSNNVWVNYFEDVSDQGDLSNLNQYNAGQTARYLLEHPQTDPSWQAHANGIISWIVANFGGTDQGEAGVQFGARVISEQLHYKYKMASHTARFGAINALYAEATGDTAAKDRAFRSLNWSTYMCRDNGVTIEGPAESASNPPCWFTDGHGDYVRHFMLAMGAVPEWAPAGQNHLLRSSSVVQWVSYAPGTVGYRTFDATAVEVLRMSWMPARVLANGVVLPQRSDLAQPGWTFDTATAVLRIRHDAATEIRVDSAIVQHTLTVTTIGGGTVTKTPNQPGYDTGTHVTMTATPSVGWRFIGWTGEVASSGNSVVIEVDDDCAVTATFVDPSTLGRDGDAPVELSLSPVRPNPSRDDAAIEFTLPQTRAVRLSVIDLAGREVAVLADGTIPAGRHEARLWSGRHGLEPGLYFARLGMGERTLVQRFVITR